MGQGFFFFSQHHLIITWCEVLLSFPSKYSFCYLVEFSQGLVFPTAAATHLPQVCTITRLISGLHLDPVFLLSASGDNVEAPMNRRKLPFQAIWLFQFSDGFNKVKILWIIWLL